MKRLVVGRWVIVAAMVTAAFGRPIVAVAPETTTLELGADAQSPGAVALISLSLRIPEGIAVGKVVNEISYPGKLLLFEEAQRGLSAEAVGATVSAVAKESQGDVSVVEVTITAKAGEQLPPGTLAELHFKVRDEVTEELKVALKNKPSAWTDKVPPTPIQPVTGTDGEIEITKTPPVAACFFYMH